MVERSLEEVFPGLRHRPYRIKSPPDHKYNCIAFAAGDESKWWWPDGAEEDFWPAGVARVVDVEAFRDAFASMGYAVCDRDQLEPGFEKVAIFALSGVPKHAARQLPNGRWISKLGQSEDIEHDLHELTGIVYGSVVLMLKRPVASSKS